MSDLLCFERSANAPEESAPYRADDAPARMNVNARCNESSDSIDLFK